MSRLLDGLSGAIFFASRKATIENVNHRLKVFAKLIESKKSRGLRFPA
jgi:hypothetical protein